MAARIGTRFEAPLLFAGTCNMPLFNRWLESEFCPLLNDNHGVVMGHVAFHKSETPQKLIAAKGATLRFLPPYSPDLNPIEHAFATRKKIREYHEHDTLDNLIKAYQ